MKDSVRLSRGVSRKEPSFGYSVGLFLSENCWKVWVLVFGLAGLWCNGNFDEFKARAFPADEVPVAVTEKAEPVREKYVPLGVFVGHVDSVPSERLAAAESFSYGCFGLGHGRPSDDPFVKFNPVRTKGLDREKFRTFARQVKILCYDYDVLDDVLLTCADGSHVLSGKFHCRFSAEGPTGKKAQGTFDVYVGIDDGLVDGVTLEVEGMGN